jgi:hypothetical protein
LKKDNLSGLQIIGAGFGRTGTRSLKAALDILGYGPCYHMQTALLRPWHLKFWIRAAAGETVEYIHLFRKYKATVDWPACEFYKELMEVYPEAKVILNVRDPEEWHDSMMDTIWKIQPVFRRSFPKAYRKVHDDLIWDSRFQGEFENREKAIAIYNAYNEEVKKTVPSENILVYNVTEGWKPLCEFLGKGEPENIPFPRFNSRKTFKKLLRFLKILEWAIPIVLILAAIFIGVLVF